MKRPPSFVVPLIPVVAGLLAFASCQAVPPGEPAADLLSVQEIGSHIRFLSDDLLEGRMSGGRGIALAALYQESVFRGAGLEPAFGSSYRQAFDLKGCAPDQGATIRATAGKTVVPLRLRDDFVVKAFREDAPETAVGELVYVGFGIRAPERGWDDLKGVDVKGKVLLVEINEPGNVPGGIFDGEAMTYHGRWPSKFEKAAELGAAGCLIIHNTKGAAYGWEVVQNSWTRENFFLPDKPQPLDFQGWLTGEAAARLAAAAGLELKALTARAEKGDFTPVPLGIRVEVRQKCGFRTVPAENVVGLLPGTAVGDKARYIVLSAHYDHLGMDPSRPGDRIFNGAVDNCSASAALLALARAYGAASTRPEATLVFAAFSAEEELYLGSDYFVRHMPFPAAATLADVNFEMTGVWGETEDVYTIGGSLSDLDGVAAGAAANLGLRYIPERDAELGYFYRSDQLSFARGGIPALWVHEGITSRTKGPGYMLEKRAQFLKDRYHKVADEIEPDWDLRGTVQIARWAKEIVRLLDESPAIPGFVPTSPFQR